MHVNGRQIRGHDRVFKVVVVGESGVGKSCLVGSLCDEPFIDDRSSTIGSDVRSVTLVVEEKRIKLSVWDTAGQEKFRSLTSSFYRGAHLVLLCFDITNYETFHQTRFWFDELATSFSTSPNVVKLLIGTKLDKQGQRLVERKEAIELAAANECACYLETSAFTGSGVKLAFEEGVKRILQVAEFNQTLPKTDESVTLHGNVSNTSRSCC